MTEAAVSFAGNLPDDPGSATPRPGLPEPGSVWRCSVGGRWRVVADELGPRLRWATARPVQATRSASE
jgi:hypothetical protein